MYNRTNWIFDHELAGTQKYFYDPEYIPPLRKPHNPKVLELPPPKRFLKEGSAWFTSPDTHYMFIPPTPNPKENNKYNVNVVVHKIRIKPDRIQLIRIMFYFLREKDIMAEKRSGYKVLSYIIPKQALYSIETEKKLVGKKVKFMKNIKRISLCYDHIVNLNVWPIQFLTRWLTAMYNAVKADIPDVKCECYGAKKTIISLMLQHRVGKSIPGLNDQLINNLCTLTRCKYTAELAMIESPYKGDPSVDITKDIAKYVAKTNKNLRRRTVYKFIPTLKQTGSTNKGLQVMLNQYSNKSLIKIINKMHLDMIVPDDTAIFISKFNNIPKSLKHWISHLLNENTDDANQMIKDIIIQTVQMLKDDKPPHIVSNWITTMKRLNAVILWRIWEDLYRISEILLIRIRPAQFMTIEDIINEHDMYAERMRNTKVFVAGVPENKYRFVKVDHPKVLTDNDGAPVREWFIIQILSYRKLRYEQIIMGHCVDTYGGKCMLGNSIIFSIRDRRGNHLFTAEYDKNFKFIQAEGPVGKDRKRTFPNSIHIEKFFVPLGNLISLKEIKKPLDYKWRVSANTTLIKLKWELQMLQNSDNLPENIEIIAVNKIESDIKQHIKDIAIMEDVNEMILRNDEPATILRKMEQVNFNRTVVNQKLKNRMPGRAPQRRDRVDEEVDEEIDFIGGPPVAVPQPVDGPQPVNVLLGVHPRHIIHPIQ